MAHVQKRTRNGNIAWRARYRTVDGRERSKTFPRKTDAEKWVINAQAEMNRGNYIDPTAGQISLSDYAEQWRRAQVHRSSTEDTTKSRLNRHVLPTFGHRTIASILRQRYRRGSSGREYQSLEFESPTCRWTSPSATRR